MEKVPLIKFELMELYAEIEISAFGEENLMDWIRKELIT